MTMISLGVGARPWSVIAVSATTGGVTAAQALEADKQHFATSISGFSDTDCKVRIDDGSTVLLEFDLDVSLQGKSFNITGLCLPGTPGTAMNGVITASTSDCACTLAGFTVP